MVPEIKELSIVLNGNFNPAIINPFWLASKGLIAENLAESATAKDYINHPEVSQFSLGYCVVQALDDKITVGSTQEGYFTHVRDLLVNIFTVLLESPVKQVGINFGYHYRFQDRDRWLKFSNSLVAVDKWHRLCENARMTNLEITSKRDDDRKGILHHYLGLSDKIPPAQHGLRFSINDHFELNGAGDAKAASATEATELLKEAWESSLARIERLAGELFV